MGYWGKKNTIHIAAVVGPGPGATHEQHRFVPDHPWQTQRIEEIYIDSGRRTSYLGDWHTHPDGEPRPSIRDKATARLIAEHPPARAPKPILLISSINALGEILPVPYIRRRRLSRARLKISDCGAVVQF